MGTRVNTGGLMEFVYEKDKHKKHEKCDRCGAAFTKRFFYSKHGYSILCSRCMAELSKEKNSTNTRKNDFDSNDEIQDKFSFIGLALLPFVMLFLILKTIVKYSLKFWYIFPLILTFAAIYYATTATVIAERNETIPIIITEVENRTIESIISIERYIEDPYYWDGKEETLQGYLKRYVRRMPNNNAGVYVDVLIDDFDNEIDLIQLKPEFRSLFINLSPSLFEVSGTFKRTYQTLEFIPNYFQEIQRPQAGVEFIERNITTYETSTENITLPKYPVVRNFVYSLLNKDVECSDGTVLGECSIKKPYFCGYNDLIEKPTECGCPEGYRLHNRECIVIVECSDGTLEPDCSEEKPQQCVDGTLIDKASVCGCPADYRRIGDSCEKILRCSDGTIYGECSQERPLFCENGRLIEKASKCGCPSGFTAVDNICVSRTELEAKEVFEYLNELRSQKRLARMVWDDRAYDMAVSRSKDMYERGYFSHLTPEGECMLTLKSRFGFRSNEIVAENLGGMTHYGNNIPIASTSIYEPLESWIASPGHYENLFYSKHTKGAIGCYKAICAFYGVHNDIYGLGAAPCWMYD